MHARPGLPALLVALLALLGAPGLVPAARAQTIKPPTTPDAGPGPAPAAQPQTGKPPTTAAKKPLGPKKIGVFEDWIAATNKEAGLTVCYALTYAQSSSPALSGRDRVVLTVTERQGGRDAVALSAGFAYAQNATVSVVIDTQPSVDFYTGQRSAFSRDGHATVQGFLKGLKVVATSPGPKSVAVADTFSLKGFNAAYAAIVKACPPGKGGQ